MAKFIITGISGQSVTVEANSQADAIKQAVDDGFASSMADFYYDIDDGCIEVVESMNVEELLRR